MIENTAAHCLMASGIMYEYMYVVGSTTSAKKGIEVETLLVVIYVCCLLKAT